MDYLWLQNTKSPESLLWHMRGPRNGIKAACWMRCVLSRVGAEITPGDNSALLGNHVEGGRKPVNPGARKYSYASVQHLAKVWAWSGGMSGKYLAVSMRLNLDLLEVHGECVIGRSDYSTKIRQELLSMSAATIDRYLAPARRKNTLRGFAATTAGPLLRNSITVRKAGDEVEGVPGFFEGDTVAHCGNICALKFPRIGRIARARNNSSFTKVTNSSANFIIHQFATFVCKNHN